MWCRAGGSSVTDSGRFSGGERIRQTAQNCAVGVEHVQDTVVKANGHPTSAEVEADRILLPGEGEQATA